MSCIQLIVGSVGGTAECASEALEMALQAHGRQVSMLIDPTPQHVRQPGAALTLIVTSTDDNGQLPRALRPLWRHLVTRSPALHKLQYAVAVLGDSQYGDKYCLGGKNWITN